MQQAFRQLEERSVSSEIVLMEWSPKMDLIALSNKNGEVSPFTPTEVKLDPCGRGVSIIMICQKFGPVQVDNLKVCSDAKSAIVNVAVVIMFFIPNPYPG